MKTALRAFLGFLALTALVAILSVLGGEFDKIDGKIIITSLTLSLASICAMSCAAFISRNHRTRVDLAGIGAAIISAMLTIAGIWWEISSDTYWHTTLTFGVSTFACAHSFLLILPDLGRSVNRWFRPAALVFVVVLALQVIVAAWNDIGASEYYRVMAAVAIIVALETASLPILIKLRKDKGASRQKLVLEKQDDGTYSDSTGRNYHVNIIDIETR